MPRRADDAAHARPRDHQAAADRRPQHRSRRMKTEAAIAPADDRVERHVPGEPHDDDREQNGARDDEVTRRCPPAEASSIGRICRPMKMKASMLSSEDDCVPHGVRRDADRRGHSLRCRARHVIA